STNVSAASPSAGAAANALHRAGRRVIRPLVLLERRAADPALAPLRGFRVTPLTQTCRNGTGLPPNRQAVGWPLAHARRKHVDERVLGVDDAVGWEPSKEAVHRTQSELDSYVRARKQFDLDWPSGEAGRDGCALTAIGLVAGAVLPSRGTSEGQACAPHRELPCAVSRARGLGVIRSLRHQRRQVDDSTDEVVAGLARERD